MSDGPGDHIAVSNWGDIDAGPDVVSGRDKQRVATVFRDMEWDSVVWIPDWILDDDDDTDLETVEASDNLVVGQVDDYSAKSWRVYQPHRKDESPDPGGYVAKSQTVHFERTPGLEDIDTPQTGLDAF